MTSTARDRLGGKTSKTRTNTVQTQYFTRHLGRPLPLLHPPLLLLSSSSSSCCRCNSRYRSCRVVVWKWSCSRRIRNNKKKTFTYRLSLKPCSTPRALHSLTLSPSLFLAFSPSLSQTPSPSLQLHILDYNDEESFYAKQILNHKNGEIWCVWLPNAEYCCWCCRCCFDVMLKMSKGGCVKRIMKGMMT